MALDELARKLSVPTPIEDWRALIDALIAQERAVELDWRSEPDEVREGITAIGGRIEEKAWNRVLNLAGDESAAEILHGVARAVGAAKKLVEIVRPTDTIVVTFVPRSSLPKLQAIARAAGGALRDLARERPAARSARRIREAPAGSWRRAVLDLDLDATSTLGIVFAIVRDPRLIPVVEEELPKAPAEDRALVAATIALLRRRTPRTDPITYVRALGHVSRSVKHAPRALGLLAAAAKEHTGVAFRREVVQAVRFPMQESVGRPAFAKLPAKDRALLRGLVHAQLGSRDSTAFHAALGAARIAGDASTRALLRKLGAGSTYEAREARASLAFLMKTKGEDGG